MDNNQIVLIKLLALSMRGEKASYDLVKSVDWVEVLHLAEIHSVLPIIYTSLEQAHVDRFLFDGIKSRVLQAAAQQIRNLSIFEKIADRFEEANIPLLAMKGLLLRALYRCPETRTMSDFDFSVPEENFEAAIQVLKKMGFKISGYGRINHIEMNYGGNMLIELHRRPFEEEFINLPEDYTGGLWKNAIPVDICGKTVLSYSDNDNILYLCLHLLKHYKEGGFGLRQLYDITIFIEAKSDKIDWKWFYQQILRLHILKFTSMVFTLCHQFFAMRLPEYLYEKIIMKDDVLDHIIPDILEGGTFGLSTGIRHASSRVMRTAGWNRPAYTNKASSVLKFLFPNHELLGEKYLYAKRYPILLPAAWVHRWCYNAVDRRQRELVGIFFRKGSAIKSMEIIKKRRKLISWLTDEEIQGRADGRSEKNL